MSGFEVIGLILGLYPLIGTALKTYKATKGGKGAKRLVRDLKVEELIFGEFVHHLLAPNVTEAELVRLKDPKSLNATSWRNAATNMRNRLGPDKASIIIEISQEICALLRTLQNELSSSNHGVELLQKFHSNIRDFKHCLPQSEVKKTLDQLTANNLQLQRLLTDRSLPSNVISRKRVIQTRQYLRKDFSHVVDLYNAISSGYRCLCDAPHFANFGLPQIPDFPHIDNEGLRGDRQFEFLFPLDKLEVSEYNRTSDIESERLIVFKARKEPSCSSSGNTRRISICECDEYCTDEQHSPTINLCIFVQTLDQHHHVPDSHLGVLRLKEKLYKLQAPQENPPNIVCLEDLLVQQDRSLSRRDRITLALRLSYAILQFYYTPWIEACWTWGDFCMDRHNDSDLFVTRKFYSTCNRSKSSDRTPASHSEFWAIRGEPILTRLGYALVELAFGKRLSQLRSENQYHSKDPDMLDFLTAKHLVESGCIMREESIGYENVVRACLFHQFLCTSDLKVIDSSRQTFYEDVERSIIAPLHKIWISSWGTL